MEERPQSSRIFIARQPIFRRNLKVYAYELLFRSGLDNFFDPSQDGERATSNVVTESFLVLGIANVTMGRRAFINFSGPMILRGWPALLPRDDIVVEVLEDVEVTAGLIDACRSLAEKGYLLALDDFVYHPRFDPLLELAGIVKFDVLQMDRAELARQAEMVKSRFRVRLLAEKVESDEEFAALMDMGFDLFQGYFFRKPHIISGLDIPGSKLHYFEILRQVNDENFDFGRLAALIAEDVSLSYKLLRYVNSPVFRRRGEIDAIGTAVALLGEDELRRWLSVVMMSYMARDKPDELVRLAVIRGRFCESLGVEMEGRGRAGAYHAVGMFSLLDALLDRPMDELVAGLNLSRVIAAALTGREDNRLFRALELVRAYETGHWRRVSEAAAGLGVDTDLLPPMFMDAIEGCRCLEESMD